ncbi:MAG: helix-turn-helix domain-containing protein [Clostridia bacterium]|nr:helix-turn-helix domain-containing protein [Clostridia bacterium]
MTLQTKETKELFAAILSIDTAAECGKFFDDICTVKELQDLSQRFQVAKLLKAGKSYQEISKETGASTATISRVNRALVYGSGGYKSVLKKLEEK